MNTYSVTGTYAYRDGAWGDGSGQHRGAMIDAETAVDAAETYRTDMATGFALSHPACRLTATNVCAVALTGAPEVHSDPLDGVPA